MSRYVSTAFVSVLLAAACGSPPTPLHSSSGPTPSREETAPAARSMPGPLSELPYTPSLDVSSMDRTADPCTSLYQYACGGWMRNNPIPADQASWSVGRKASDENQRFLWGILEDLRQEKAGRTATQQKIGDYFAACMDETGVEARGAAPLQPWLSAIAAIGSLHDLAPVLARLQMATGLPDGLLFSFGPQQDEKDAAQTTAFAGAGGLGLPDRDYYTRMDATSEGVRRRYVGHVARMLSLLGDAPDEAARGAESVLKIETELAKASLTRVERRDPHKRFHKTTRAELDALVPSFDWGSFLAGVGATGLTSLNVTEPAFFKQVQVELTTVPLGEWKAYLRWHLVHEKASQLSSAFVQANFDFYAHTLRGVPELSPRWKRCVSLIDEQLGEALGEEFVRRAFTPETKARAAAMVVEIERAMELAIADLGWMGPETKTRAIEKLHAVVNKIGYPEHFRDYGPVLVTRDGFAGNVERALTFEARREIAKIGKPVDRTEWFATPPTVDAYYNAQMNDMNFPAGVLRPPMFDPKLDEAPNYGNTGSTIGHELIHAFDDKGRQFDGKGNLRDWWTKADATAFDAQSACVVSQYGQYTIVDDVRINSKLTEGEDVADLGGTMLAYAAWKHAVAGAKPRDADGLTPDQRFFVGFAQWDCMNTRPEDMRLRAVTNSHSPARYRIDGVAANMPEFQSAFSCRAGQPMVHEPRCRVW